MSDTRRAPIASYRIQLTPDFGFAATIGLLDHLVALGVSHLYLSPVAEAGPGSTHGYDVVDHRAVRAELGGERGLTALLDAVHDRGLGVVIDHVPNHVSVARAELNPHWWSMLRDGPASDAARWFDVDWAATGDKVLIPKLGEPLADALAASALDVGRGDLGPELRYGPLCFPVAPGTEELPLPDLLAAQHYELMWWRDPRRNVRRFFTIDDLVGVRVEDPDVAAVVDTIPIRLGPHPGFAGVRVDHVDGLANPGGYLSSLRQRIGVDRWLLVEKILAADETLEPSWPVDGTTGYEHIRVTEHAFLDPAAEEPLTRLWNDLTGDERPFAAYEDEARREVLAGGLAPDLDRFVDAASAAGGDVRGAAIELTVGLCRYRTYLSGDGSSSLPLEDAARRAVAVRPELRRDIEALAALIRSDVTVARRWQQLTGPAMAKGAEDRAFYRYLRLASLCEVGGSPGTFTVPEAAFHDHQSKVCRDQPTTMLAGTTHDTKRSEEVRARSLALAEIADDWASFCCRWFAAHRDWLDEDALDAATVLLGLQTVVTAAPIDEDRMREYLVKSAREADVHTSWTDPDRTYERALGRLAGRLVGQAAEGELAAIVHRIRRPGWSNSLAALAIRLTAPGVADLYQGAAAFNYSLVDPDNRVAPDWAERASLVERAREVDGPSAWLGDDAEVSKAVVIGRLLAMRRRHPAAFGRDGGYEPLVVTGTAADRLIGFVRTSGGEPAVVVAVVRRSIGITGWFGTTVSLPAGSWRNVLDDDAPAIAGGAEVPGESLVGRFPVAVLDRVDR